MTITTKFSARVAILEAYSIELQGNSDFTGSPGGRPMTTSTHRLACRYEAAKIISAVEKLPNHIRAWLMWAYGPAVFAMQRSVQEGAVAAVFTLVDLPLDDMAPQISLRSRLLIYAHMDNYRAMAVTGHRKYRKPAHFDHAVRRISGGAVGFDLSGRNFGRDYGYLAALVEQACADLDKAGLPPVGAALASVRSFRDPAAPGMAPAQTVNTSPAIAV